MRQNKNGLNSVTASDLFSHIWIHEGTSKSNILQKIVWKDKFQRQAAGPLSKYFEK